MELYRVSITIIENGDENDEKTSWNGIGFNRYFDINCMWQ